MEEQLSPGSFYSWARVCSVRYKLCSSRTKWWNDYNLLAVLSRHNWHRIHRSCLLSSSKPFTPLELMFFDVYKWAMRISNGPNLWVVCTHLSQVAFTSSSCSYPHRKGKEAAFGHCYTCLAIRGDWNAREASVLVHRWNLGNEELLTQAQITRKSSYC